MDRKLSLLSAVAVLAMGLGVLTGVANAQYPQPTGGIEVQAEDTATTPGSSTTLICTVFNADGTPISSAPCTFTIVSQPGNDAEVGSITITKLTNSQGIATTELRVGSTPGIIIVEVSSEGFTSSVIVTVEGEAPSPPQAPVSGIQPPSTGSGGLLN